MPDAPEGQREGFVLLSAQYTLPWKDEEGMEAKTGVQGGIYSWTKTFKWNTMPGGYVLPFQILPKEQINRS